MRTIDQKILEVCDKLADMSGQRISSDQVYSIVSDALDAFEPEDTGPLHVLFEVWHRMEGVENEN